MGLWEFPRENGEILRFLPNMNVLMRLGTNTLIVVVEKTVTQSLKSGEIVDIPLIRRIEQHKVRRRKGKSGGV